jgi:hypothetical protein
MSKKDGPPSRADERLSNLILEGGKSQTYRDVRSARKVASRSTAHRPSANGTDRTAKN